MIKDLKPDEELETCDKCFHCRLRKGERGHCTWTLDPYQPPEAGKIVLLHVVHDEKTCPGYTRDPVGRKAREDIEAWDVTEFEREKENLRSLSKWSVSPKTTCGDCDHLGNEPVDETGNLFECQAWALPSGEKPWRNRTSPVRTASAGEPCGAFEPVKHGTPVLRLTDGALVGSKSGRVLVDPPSRRLEPMRTQHTATISSVQLVDGRFHVIDDAVGKSFVMSRHQLADYIRSHARSADHVPLGDYLHEGLKRVGFTGCLPCAERQAKLNRLVRRRRKE